MKTANIIIAQQSIPSSKNGSWTQRLEYFLESSNNNIDYVICSKSQKPINSLSKFYYVKNSKSRIINKIFPNYRYREYLKKIDFLFQTYDHQVICVIDNIKLLNTISDYIDTNSLKSKTTLLFYNCGYSYFLNQKAHTKFCKNIDEIIFLTKSAYLFNKNQYSEFTPEVSILNNPINKEIFNTEKDDSLEEIVTKYNLKDKKVFLWLSHDRKKKGMSIILNAWKSWKDKSDDYILLIVGATREDSIKNVFFIGEVNSNLVYKYYKIAHIYLFPTLWKEGFGLSLLQAIASGCFSIAADNGGVKDFFEEDYGILIKQPNIVENWIKAMQVAVNDVQKGWKPKQDSNHILSFEDWSMKFAEVFNKWNNRIISS